MNANVNQNLLRQHAVPTLRLSPNQPAIFMQDNASCHKAKWVKQFLEAENIENKGWAVFQIHVLKCVFEIKNTILYLNTFNLSIFVFSKCPFHACELQLHPFIIYVVFIVYFFNMNVL